MSSAQTRGGLVLVDSGGGCSLLSGSHLSGSLRLELLSGLSQLHDEVLGRPYRRVRSFRRGANRPASITKWFLHLTRLTPDIRICLQPCRGCLVLANPLSRRLRNVGWALRVRAACHSSPITLAGGIDWCSVRGFLPLSLVPSQTLVFLCRTSRHEPRVVGQNVAYHKEQVTSPPTQALVLETDHVFKQNQIQSNQVHCHQLRLTHLYFASVAGYQY